MSEQPTAPPPGLPRRRIVQLTLVSACIAVAGAWWIVVRPALDDTAEPQSGPAAGITEARLGQPAPEVTFPGLDGPDLVLRERRGSVVVLNFWASTCAPCIKEMPLLEAASQDRDDVSFIGLSVSESPEAGSTMVERTGVTFPQGRDPNGQMLAAFGGIALPHTVVIDADGDVVAMANRALEDRADLDELIGRAG